MIQLKQVSKNFQRQQVLDRLDLQVIPGDRIALIGQNGAGKTTLIRSLLGQYEHQGTLRVFQKDPRIERVGVLQHVGFVPQHPPPLQMNVGELVTFADSLSEKPLAEKVFELCRELELDLREHSAKPFFKLSGGMKQKLLIALTLGREPELLIMDEPAANLDPSGRKAFFQQLSRFPKSTTMVLSSHRVDELLSLVNRVVEMDCGSIVLDERLNGGISRGRLMDCELTLHEVNDRSEKYSRPGSSATAPGRDAIREKLPRKTVSVSSARFPTFPIISRSFNSENHEFIPNSLRGFRPLQIGCTP